MNSVRFSLIAAISALTFLAGAATPAAAVVPLAQKPLYLGETVKPAFIMAVDDSGSMRWDVLSRNQDGELVWGRDAAASPWGFFRDTGLLRGPGQGVGADETQDFLELFAFPGRGEKRRTIPPIPSLGFARSVAFNPGYYDPAAEYLPWQNFDGTSRESLDTLAEWQSMSLDPRFTGPRYDLTNTVFDRVDDTGNPQVDVFVNRALYAGIRLKQGWLVRSNSTTARNCPALPAAFTAPASGSAFLTLTQNYTLTAPCAAAINVQKPADTGLSDPQFGGNAEMFNVRQGMVLSAGTQYYTLVQCGGLGASHATLGTWTTLAADHTISGNCDVNGDNDSVDVSNGNVDFNLGIAYFAPTYFLTTNTSPDGNIAPTTFSNLVGGPRATTVPSAGTLYRYEIRPGNYSSYAAYSQAMTSFANWYAYYRTRNLAMVAALTRSLNDVDFMRIGYFRINQTNNGTDYTATVPPLVMHEMSDFTNSTTVAGRRSLYGQMIALPAAGSTPNGWAVNQLGLQFTRTAGTTAPVSDPPIISECQFNAGMLFTDGYSNQGRPTAAGNRDNAAPFATAPFADANSNTMGDIAAYYYGLNLRPDLTAGVVPVVPGCATATPDLRLDCNRNQHMNFYGITLGASGVNFGVAYQQDPDTLDITPDIFVAGNAPAWQGWSDNGRAAVDDIWHASVNTRGQFINATSPDRISQAMNAIIQSINTAARRSAGTAASGARRSVGFAAYVPEFDPNSWTGDVKGYNLLPSGMLGAVTWSAVEELPAPAARNILFSRPIPSVSPIRFGAVDFTKTNLGPTDFDRLTQLGLTSTQFLPGGEFVGRTVDEVVGYLRGDPASEGTVPGKFRSRALRNPDGTSQHRPIGDILGSQPEILNRASEGYSRLPVADGGRVLTPTTLIAANTPGTYSHFVTTVKSTRQPVLIVGANDGMIHGFDASLGSPGTPGRELFAVIPNSVLNKTGLLLERDYLHTFLADGTPQLSDACIGPPSGSANCSWTTVALSGMGAGGRSVIALDVTNPAVQFNAGNVLWEFSNLQDGDMGFSFNRPRAFVGEDGVWYAAFTNGLNSDNHRAKLFVVNLKTGALVRKFDLGTAGTSTDPNGAMDVLAVDGDGDVDADNAPLPKERNSYVDTLYVTDFHGNLFKLDLSAPSPSGWAVSLGGVPLYSARAIDTAERADSRQFVTGAMDVTRHPQKGNLVLFGTGRYLANGDQNVASLPQVQSFYAIWDNPEEATGVPGRAALQQQSITGSILFEGATRRQTSENPVIYRGTGAKRGWFIDLFQAAGTGAFRTAERVIGSPTIFGGNVVFTSFQPIGTQCNPGGKNWLYSLNVITGAAALVLGTPNAAGEIINGCVRCGGQDLNPGGTSAAPSQDPPIVVDPPPSAPRDNDGDGDIDADDANPSGDQNCIPGTPGCTPVPSAGNAVGGRQCLTRVSVLLPEAGLTPFTTIVCGRLSWRQVQ